ncbi:hypothetical protein MY3296_002334 [Beauveria thailandica]
MESKAPSLCRVCDMSTASPSLWRQHAKSDWQYVSHPLAKEHAGEMQTHSVVSVYNLRVKVAEPGTIITPPSPASSPRRQTSTASSHRSEPEDDAGAESDYESGDLDCNTPAAVHFDPLFAFTVWKISQKSHKGLWTFTLADASALDKTAAHGADSTAEFQASTQTPFTSV